MKPPLVGSLVGIGLALASSGALAAPSYSVVFLEPSGYHASDALGISGGQQVGDAFAASGYAHAALWSGSAGSFVDLNPPGAQTSSALAVANGTQVGFVSPGGGAALWRGTPESFVDLNPPGFVNSTALATSGDQQGGSGSTVAETHALLWFGSAESAIDLNPVGFDFSEVRGMAGGQQVGDGSGPSTGHYSHALLWTGTADSVVDLNPAGVVLSFATATDGVHQVGAASSGHAMLWSGTAGSAVDLNPAGFAGSVAYGVAGIYQVGSAGGSERYLGNNHAALWMGSADSFVDLHLYLPPEFDQSSAQGVDVNGNVVGYAWSNSDQRLPHAVMWVVPEPGAIGLMSVAAGCGLLRRRRRRRRMFMIARNLLPKMLVMAAGTLPYAGAGAQATPAYHVVFLEPPGYHPTYAQAVGGGQQVGYGIGSDGHNYGLLWAGSAASAVNLTPDGYIRSQVFATDGQRQAGSADVVASGHAAMWSGTAQSFVDLHPAQYTNSVAYGLSGNQQVGIGNVVGSQIQHALLTSR